MNLSEKQAIMRPQDVVILLKKISRNGRHMNGKQLAASLNISASEVSMAMERNKTAQLVDSTKERINILSLRDFIIYGLKYCFPAQPGRIVRGIPTASSASPMKEAIVSNRESFVWKDSSGSVRGQSITPLFPNVVKKVSEDADFYALLAIVDSIRIGKSRERNTAIELLDKYLQAYGSEK